MASSIGLIVERSNPYDLRKTRDPLGSLERSHCNYHLHYHNDFRSPTSLELDHHHPIYFLLLTKRSGSQLKINPAHLKKIPSVFWVSATVIFDTVRNRFLKIIREHSPETDSVTLSAYLYFHAKKLGSDDSKSKRYGV